MPEKRKRPTRAVKETDKAAKSGVTPSELKSQPRAKPPAELKPQSESKIQPELKPLPETIPQPETSPQSESKTAFTKWHEKYGDLLDLGFKSITALTGAISLYTGIQALINPQGVRWIIVFIYLLFIIACVAWLRFILPRRQKPLRWEAAIVVLFAILNTAVLFLWAATWLDDLKCGYYGLKIESPKPGAVMDGVFTVSGSYRFVPPADSLVLVNEASGEVKYWPSSYPIKIDHTLNQWSGEFYLGGASGSKANVDIVMVGKPGRVLYQYYLQVGKDTNGQWPSIPTLTDDMKICDAIEVVKK